MWLPIEMHPLEQAIFGQSSYNSYEIPIDLYQITDKKYSDGPQLSVE